MTDEIFDYFGGNSPRKIEPIEEDDFFGDLMPKKPAEINDADEEIVEEPAVVEESVQQHSDEATEEFSAEASPESDVEEKDEPAPVKSHWDMLASALGLAPKKQKQKAKPKDKSESKVKSESKPKPRSKPAKKTKEQPIEAADSSASNPGNADSIFDLEADARPKEQSGEVLSGMFVPKDADQFETPVESESYSRNKPELIDDDDPFAAFHSPTKSTNESPSSDVDASVSVEPEEEETHLVVDDDFVEFEVREFGQGRGDRAPKRKSRRRPERNDREEQPETTSRRKRPARRDDVDRDEESNRRGPRSKRDGGQRDSGPRDSRQREEVKEREGTRRKRKKSRNSRDEEMVHDDNEGSNRKKPKIPTWEDAISGVIDMNIKRHKSNSGRGGRKRR